MKFLRKISLVVASILMSLTPMDSVFAAVALPESTLNYYAQNNILFYDPCVGVTSAGRNSSSGDSPLPSGGNYAALKEGVRRYGEFAMQMQKKYGTPWEVVFAQMQNESQMGTTGVAASGATNNWLGITGSGDAGTWVSEQGRKWAKFSSVEKSIEYWAGPHVLRNGMYDAAFPYLDPSNWDLEMFLIKMINVYAPPTDGNNPEAYVQKVMRFINGPIAEVREEMGWPSSEELAKQYNIEPDGLLPVDSEITGEEELIRVGEQCDGDGSVISGECGERIARTAVLMAWPDRGHFNKIKPEYEKGLAETVGDTSLAYAQDCGHFVATVILTSGVDKGFPVTYTVNQENHMSGSSLWEEVPNTGNVADLMPGDVMVNAGHIMIFVGSIGGGAGNLAQASAGLRTGYLLDLGVVYGRNGYFGDPSTVAGGSRYRIYRFVCPDGEKNEKPEEEQTEEP